MNNTQCTYGAGFMGKETTFKADSLGDAKDKAVAHFSPSKKNKGLVWVVLLEKRDGTAYIHSTSAI